MHTFNLSSLLVYTFATMTMGCTGENVIDNKRNSPPLIQIMSHSDGVEVQDSYTEHFRAIVSDDDNEFNELTISWYVGEEIVCDWTVATPAGDALCDIVFHEGDENVIAEVRDTQGAGARAEIAISVLATEAPVVELLAPLADGRYYSDGLIEFSAIVGDAEDDADELILTWSSSIDGVLPLDVSVDANGNISDYGYLTEGNHAIELLVEDVSGKIARDSVVISVGPANSAPNCDIVEPIDGDAFVVGTSIQFRGFAEDVDVNADTLLVEWMSDKDGSFGTSTPSSSGAISFASTALSANVHTITMRVTDEIGATCSDQIVLAVGNPPSATIDSPLDGSIYAVGESIPFRGTVSDPEDFAGDIAVVWHSDLDGDLYSANPSSQGISQFSRNDLSTGLHYISFTATDTTGLYTDQVISFRVNTPPVVNSIVFSPNPVYSSSTLSVTANATDADGQNVSLSYAWYENGSLTAFTGTTINSSELDVGEVWTVRVTPHDGFVDGNYVEQSITVYNNAPVVSSVTISPSSNVYNDTVVMCSAVASDADQTVIPTYSWSWSGGSVAGASLNLSNILIAANEILTCTATVTDSQGSSASLSNSVVIANRAPSISSVSISPNSVMTNSTVTCSAVSSDLDGQNLTTTYQWFVGANSIGSGSSLTLNSQLVQPNNTLECRATVTDTAGSSSTQTASTTVSNSPITITSSSLTPSNPTPIDTLVCSASYSDVDGGTPVVNFAFTNQTTGQTYTPTSSNNSSAELNLTTVSFTSTDTIACTITVSDGFGSSDTDVQTVSISSTGATMTTPVITPNTGVYTNTSLSCSSTATDVVDGNISSNITYAWLVGGNVVGTGSTYVVSANQTNVGDTVVCRASVTNSLGDVSNVTGSVVVSNTTPVLSNIRIIPNSSIYNDTTVSCTATVTDPDETLTISYTWSSGGVELGSGGSLDLGTTALLPGDELFCTAEVVDGSGATDSLILSVILFNRAPNVPTVQITWSGGSNNPSQGDSLTCSATGVDPDGDALSYTYTWITSANGAPTSGANIAGSYVVGGDTWTCSAVASDGSLSSVAGNATVVITVPLSCYFGGCDEIVDLGNGVGFDMVQINHGSFSMGSPSNEVGRQSNETQHQVTLTQDFMVMTTEVTQSMFFQLMGYHGYQGRRASYDWGSGSDYPVYYTSWDMAADFANAVTQQQNALLGLNMQECYVCSNPGVAAVACVQAMNPYQCDGYRLLTEAEWEYSARAGSTAAVWTANGGANLTNTVSSNYTTSDGFDLRTYAWHTNNAGGTTRPVAQKMDNSWGLYDMSGNVWEWVHDYDATLSTSSMTDPVTETATGGSRIRRGGQFGSAPYDLRSAKRGGEAQTGRQNYMGFRLARFP